MTPELPLSDPALPPGADLLAEGRAEARDWRLGSCLFLQTEGVASEGAYKRREAAKGRIMQHAHIGFRSVARTTEAMAQLVERAARHGARIDRYNLGQQPLAGYVTSFGAPQPHLGVAHQPPAISHWPFRTRVSIRLNSCGSYS